MPRMEIVAEPQLSIVAFRLADRNLNPDQMNNLNRELLHRVNARRRVFLTATTLGNRFVIRICVLSFRTHMDRMQAAIEDIRAAAEELDFVR